MTRLGFLLDSQSCIGCHACTVACKSEHDVPLGVNRTWVKYVETGTFPQTTRHFSVMRCNQCDDAPCMAICPTSALYRAPNGVVDFQDDHCIGCKACMNACPYDALYINPETDTAHKCNLCNHRVEVGLEPACQIVCPTQAIVVGDLDDPTSTISRAVATGELAVRSPEQGTNPKVHYRGAHEAALDPTLSTIAADGLIWADTTPSHPTVPGVDPDLARTAYTTAHPITWKEKVSGYLVTKAVAGGVMMIAALLAAMGHADAQAAVGVVPAVVAGVFLAATGALLVADLKQPTRFHYLLTRGNRSSWLVKGAYVLMAFAAVTAAWFFAGVAGTRAPIEVLATPAALLGAATAGYTAFLFAQCEGRDLWQSPWLLPALLGRAVIAGASAYAVIDLFADVPEPTTVRWALLGGVAVVALATIAEVVGRHTRHVGLAVHDLVRGGQRRWFWAGVVLGLELPALIVILDLVSGESSGAFALAGVAAVVGMFLAETAYVRAGQSVPLS